MGEGKLTPLTTPTPLNRQSPNIAHVIMSTISPHMPHSVKIAPGSTSPHIAKITTQFFLFFLLCTQNLSTDLEFRPLNRCWHAIHQQTRIHAGWCLLAVRTQYFHIFTINPPKTILGTYNGKPMGTTYSHNCMMQIRCWNLARCLTLPSTWSSKRFSVRGTAEG